MSVERELLIAAVEWLQDLKYMWADTRDSGDRVLLELIADIKRIEELLAQPDINTQYLLDQVARLTAENAMLKEKWLAQPEQEPVAWIIETEIEGKLSEWVCTEKRHYMDASDGKDPIPLYTSPPTREPIDTRTISLKMFREGDDVGYINGYVDGIRFAEKAHAIGGENE